MHPRQLIRKLRSGAKSLYFDPATPKETFFLASSGRSGSTWIQEVLSKTGNYRILFEPFHSHKIELLSEWEYRQFINRNDSGNEFIDAARTIIQGDIRHPWIDQDNVSFFPKKRFIKEIRANLHIAWLKTHFPAIRLIFLMRHPFAVARSRMRVGWGADLDLFLLQNNLVKSHFINDFDFLKSIETEFGKQLAFWSIENIVPLRELSEGDAYAIAYEDIKDDPMNELNRISSNLGISTQKLDLNSIMKPSRTSWTNSKATTVLDSDIEEGYRILEHFGLDSIYGKDERRLPKLATRNIFSEFEWGDQDAALNADKPRE